MLFQLSEHKQMHLQGAYISDDDVLRLTDHLRLYWKHECTVNSGCLSSAINHDVVDVSSEVIGGEQNYIDPQQEPATPMYESMNSTITPTVSAYDIKLSEIIMWTLTCKTMSSRLVEDIFNMSFRTAQRFLEKMQEWNIISSLHVKSARQVLLNCYEEVSADVLALLKRCGHTEEQIREAFDIRK
jgi:DNA segregation ATPase FtsK/SpoIIIE-like protein